MLRMIIQVEAPDDEANQPGVYKTFDVMNTDMEKFLASAGIKGILGYEIRDNPPAPVVAKKEEPKPPAPDDPPKATGNPIQDKIAEMRHRQALRLKEEGKLPSAKSPTETLLERLARWQAEQKAKEEAEKKEKEEKAVKERKKAREKAMQEFNALPWFKRVGRAPPNGATA
jgi:hypothetical protein